jgi:transcription antitermination factor NusG
VRESLEGFIDVNTKKVTPMDNEFYSSLFEAKETKDVQFKDHQYVRICKGVYEGDLGKISKIKKNNCSVVLVPRINVQDILLKMREETARAATADEKTLLARKDEILRRYTNPRMYYPPHLRPPKKMLSIDVFKDFSDLPSNRKFEITGTGLIQLNFRYDELGKPEGTMLPIEMQPFSKNGNLVEEFQDEEERKNVVSTIRLEKGEEAEIVAGELAGCYGTVLEVRDSTVAIKCRNKEMAGKVVEEHIDHLCKRFREGQRVKVVSGT